MIDERDCYMYHLPMVQFTNQLKNNIKPILSVLYLTTIINTFFIFQLVKGYSSIFL